MFSNQCPSLERVPSVTTAANALLGMHDMIGKSIRYNGRDFCILGTGFHVGEPGFLVQGCPVRGCEDDECLRDPTYVNYAGMVRWCTSYLPNAPKEGLLKTRKSFKNAIYKKTLAHRRLMRARQEAASEASAVVASEASATIKSEESEENVVVESEEDEPMEEEEVVVKTESGQEEESDEEVTTTVTTTVETRVETTVETTVETIAVTSVATQTDA